MKKFFVILLGLVGAAATLKCVSAQREKNALWAEITDEIPSA